MPSSTGPIGAALSAALRFIPTAASTKAADIVSRGTVRGHHDVPHIGRQLANHARQDPSAAAETKQAVMALLTPVEQGALERTLSEQRVSGQQVDAQTALQRDNFPEYARQLRPTLAPQDRDNPFAYSLGADVPIEIKRQVFAEYQSGRNAPTVELARMSGANASFDESRGRNGTIQINADLLGNPGIAGQPGQFETFAVWGHLEEVGHWGDMRAQQLMGRPGGDAVGDEGARFALMSLPSVTNRANPQTFLANYDIALSNGTTRSVQVDTVVLRALAANKVASGSFATENRVGGTEHFGPEGHYQTTYITATGVGIGLGLNLAETDRVANQLALGSQLPDMLANYDATSNLKHKAGDIVLDIAQERVLPFSTIITGSNWTPAEQRHLENVYEGLHAIPRSNDANTTWQNNERQVTRNFIVENMRTGNFLTAGVAIHRYGDLYAHVNENGIPYSGDAGHSVEALNFGPLNKNAIQSATNAGHSPDFLYTEDRNGRPAAWNKVITYQSELSSAITDGLIAYKRQQNPNITLGSRANALKLGSQYWRQLYNAGIQAGAQLPRSSITKENARIATEVLFSTGADTFIRGMNNLTRNDLKPLPLNKTAVEGNYSPIAREIRAVEDAMRALQH